MCETLTIEETAAKLGVSLEQVREFIDQGELVASECGQRIRVNDLAVFMIQCERKILKIEAAS